LATGMVSEEEVQELRLALAKALEKIAELEKEMKQLRKELRKYRNENTPSGSIPPYLKEELQTSAQEPKEQTESKPNSRNARATPDRTEQHFLKACPDCGGGLRKKSRTYERTVLHLQPAVFENVLHECQAYYCKKCRKEVVPKIEGTIPNCKFDLATAVLISYLYVATNMSMGNMRHLFLELFGVSISKGTISNSLTRLKEYLGDEYFFLEQQIKEAEARYRDETGWRKNGKLFWNWVIATSNAVVYRLEKSRCHKNAGKIVGKTGVDVSDGYKAYNQLKTRKQRCWAHLIRLAKNPEHPFALDQEIGDYEKLAKGIFEIYHDAKVAKKRFKPSARRRRDFDKRLLAHLQTVRWHSKNSSKLTNYIMQLWGEWFTFLEFAAVEPTNNTAERALRHIVIKRKVSQQSRGDESMDSYAMQASLFMTARQNGDSYAEYLRHVVDEKMHGVGKS